MKGIWSNNAAVKLCRGIVEWSKSCLSGMTLCQEGKPCKGPTRIYHRTRRASFEHWSQESDTAGVLQICIHGHLAK